MDKLLRQWEKEEEGAGGRPVRQQLTREEAEKVLGALLRVRQACCHPQVAEGETKAQARLGVPLPMTQVLDNMIRDVSVPLACQAGLPFIGSWVCLVSPSWLV